MLKHQFPQEANRSKRVPQTDNDKWNLTGNTTVPKHR
jgi:hypothetical protein